MNDVSRGAYNINSQIKFKTSMLRSSLCEIVTRTYLLLKLWQSQTQKLEVQQIIEPKKQYLESEVHLLIAQAK